MKQQFLEVGKITNVHGLMGEVRVQPWADSPDFLCQFKTLYVDKTHWPIRVERARVHKNMVILKLEGVQIKHLTPGSKPQVVFALTQGDSVVSAYAYCNLHGLWKA